MKHIMSILLVFLSAACLFAQQGGIITELTGDVELKHAGQTDYVQAKAGDTINTDTIVSTGFRSTAIIKAGSAVLIVRPLTRLTLSEISSSAGTETLNVSLQAGRVRVDVNPPGETRASMTVQSPVATASVRGTSFEFDTQSLTVLEGTVAFTGSSGGVMLVGAGFTSGVNENGRSIDPLPSYAADIWPHPPAGSDTGYISSGTAVPGVSYSEGEFIFGFKLY